MYTMSTLSTASMSRLLRLFVLPLVGLVAITGALGAAAAPEPEDDPGSPVLVLPGPDAGTLDETDRATTLGGLSDTDGTVVASSAMSDTDRAAILVAIGGSGQPAAASVAADPAIQLVESTFAPGGHLATWDEVEATAAAAVVLWPAGPPF